MTECIEYQHNKDKRKRKGVCKQCGNTSDFVCSKCRHRKQYNDIDLKEMILDFIEDNRPTDVQTDWGKGCAYICDEIEKLLM